MIIDMHIEHYIMFVRHINCLINALTDWSWICEDEHCLKAHRGCWEHDCHCSCDSVGSNEKCMDVKASHTTCNAFKCADKYCAGNHVNEKECNRYAQNGSHGHWQGATGSWTTSRRRRRRRRLGF